VIFVVIFTRKDKKLDSSNQSSATVGNSEGGAGNSSFVRGS
jgi:hypothetical protein